MGGVISGNGSKGSRWLNRDLKFVLSAWSLRSIVLGYMTIAYGIFLSKVGLDLITIGIILTSFSLINTLLMALVAFFANKYGKRKLFIVLGIVTALASLALVFAENPLVIVAISLAGMTTVGAGGAIGGGGGPFNVLQDAMLADNSNPKSRNTVFALNSVISSLGSAGGALLVGLPPIVALLFGLSDVRSFAPLFAIASALTFLMIVMISRVSERPVKEKKKVQGPEDVKLEKRSGRIIRRYALLQAADGFGTSLVIGNILSLWFIARFGAAEGQIAIIFSLANLIGAASYIFGGKIANRIGAVRAVLVTHLPTNILLLAIPFMPTLTFATAVFLIRSSFDKMDIPIRTSYIMGVVRTQDRVKASGASGIARRAPSSFGAATTGFLIETSAFAVPFITSSILQSINDIGFYLMFRKIRPPEERERFSSSKSL